MKSVWTRRRALAALIIFVLVPALSAAKPTISAPTIDPPLYACATTLSVKGFIPGATIDIWVNGTTRIGGGVSDSPWGQSFAVNPPLSAGQIVTATQTFGGATSLPSEAITVTSYAETVSSRLPKPIVSKPLYDCGGALAVTNLAKGGLLRVFADGNPIGQVDGCGEGQWLRTNPVLANGSSVDANETLCASTSQKSDPVVVQPAPATLPKIVIGEIYDGGKYCIVENITNGALVELKNGAHVVDKGYYPGGSQVARLTPPPSANDVIIGTQSLCATTSDPSDPVTVGSCADLPPPKLAPICPGDKSVKIAKGVIGARIQVYANGVLAADGGGDSVNLFQPAKLGETYTAVQSVGSCTSDPSPPLAVGCGIAQPLKQHIPNGGRAVAIGVDPSDSNNIMVASETGGLFRSKDKGVNWSHVSSDTTFTYTDVTYVPGSPGVIVATANQDTRTSSGGGIWRSTDGGDSWKKPALSFPVANCGVNAAAFALSVEKEKKRVWGGTRCGLAYSDDAGLSWTYLPVGTGYANDKVLAVLSPDPKRLVILTPSGVEVSKDGGASFTQSSTGLPTGIVIGVHNQIAMPRRNTDRIYWAFNYWTQDATTKKWQGHIALYRSTDYGTSWRALIDKDGINRPPFVRIAETISDEAGKYDVYFGDGGCSLQRATVDSGAGAGVSAWTALSFDHCDPADMAFDNDGRTPLLLASDGGLHATKDQGNSWTYTGGGDHGYNALQITEVVGQLHQTGSNADLYFATQDNDIWASPDGGASWTAQRCCEGFFLNIPRSYYAASETRLTGVSCGACGNFISERLLAGQAGFTNPPNDNGNPRLLKPGYYIHNTKDAANPGSIFALTEDTGASWNTRYSFAEDVKDLSKVAGPSSDPVVYTAVKRPGTTPDGKEIVQMKRIAGVLGSGTPVVSDVGGIGSLGVFATMFAWYQPFGVDPANSNYLIAPDVVDGEMKVSTDAGGIWTADPVLTNLITQGPEFKFYMSPFTQMSSVGFDPNCKGHIFVGTQQAGIMTSYDSGATWGRVAGTEVIPYVSSFFFMGGNQAIVSSYGRGLWKLSYSCPGQARRFPRRRLKLEEAVLYWNGATIPLGRIDPPASCEACRFFLTSGGEIVDYALNPRTGEITKVVIDRGTIAGYTFAGREVDVPFRVARSRRGARFPRDRELAELLSDTVRVKGLYLDGTVVKGVILSPRDLKVGDLPRPKQLGPRIKAEVQETGRRTHAGPSSVLVRGWGFDRRYPLEVMLDGEPLQLGEGPVWETEERFVISIPPTAGLGGHTVLVRQRTDAGVVEDATSFLITVKDQEKPR